MITKSDILKMVRVVHRHSQGLPPRRMIYPAREWGRGLVAAVLLSMIAFVASIYLYVQLSTLETRLDPPVVETVRYRENTVARALEQMADHETRFVRLQATAPGPQAVPTTTTPVVDGVTVDQSPTTTPRSAPPVAF